MTDTPEDEFPPANDKLKAILRSKAPWETDDKQEPYVAVSRADYERLKAECATLRAERDELRELLAEAEIHCPHDPVQNLIGDRIRAALNRQGETDGDS